MCEDAPGLIWCPCCNELVTTEVKYVPGCSAWCTCVLLFCGFCLIPLWMRRLQDAHHSCPRCREKVHVYKR
uniref:LITAF domain-containing protein n=1 Tax=Nothobranchius furzeri TaxID=105023 RepID=A0A8C6PN35_NOTFU